MHVWNVTSEITEPLLGGEGCPRGGRARVYPITPILVVLTLQSFSSYDCYTPLEGLSLDVLGFLRYKLDALRACTRASKSWLLGSGVCFESLLS